MKTNTTTVTLLPSVFARAMGAALIAASTEKHKPHLRSVCVTCNDGFVEFVATDGFRLNLVTVPTNCKPSDPALVSLDDAIALVKLAKTYAKGGDETQRSGFVFSTDPDGWTVTAGATTSAGQVIRADFPAYRPLFPANGNAETGTMFDAAFLADIGRTAETLWPKNVSRITQSTARATVVNMEPRKPSVWTIETADGLTCSVLLMPLRPAER